MAISEAIDHVLPMLPDAFDQIAADAGIKRAITSAGQDVDGWLFVHSVKDAGFLLPQERRDMGMTVPGR